LRSVVIMGLSLKWSEPPELEKKVTCGQVRPPSVERATAIDVYTAQPIHDYLDDILRPAGPAAIHGVRWFPSRPPIQGLEFEVDLRGVARELVL